MRLFLFSMPFLALITALSHGLRLTILRAPSPTQSAPAQTVAMIERAISAAPHHDSSGANSLAIESHYTP